MALFTEEQEKTVARLMALAMNEAQKNTPASTTLTAPTLHGPFHGNANQLGIFSNPGVRPQRFSTLARPSNRLVRQLMINQSIYTKERLELMTGVTAASGTNATAWCADPPTVGQGKVCEQDYDWGEFYAKTQLNAIPATGEYVDRADVPADILNQSPEMHPLIPSAMWVLEQRQARYQMWLVGVAAERSLDIALIQGNETLASTATNFGWIAEFKGLDRQIATGYTDAKTGVACPAADSAVVSFNAEISGSDANGDNIVQAVSDLYYGLKQRAMSFGMEETMWGIVLRPEMFRPLTEQWSCNYATYRCAGSGAADPFVNDVRDTNALRLEMMGGMYLLIDGEAVPVFFSEGIDIDQVAFQHYKSDMYVVPLDWRGLPLLRVEYFPMNNPEAVELSNASAIQRQTLNNGLWLVSSEDTALCTELHFATKMRLILETPFLAGRVDDVRYTFRAPIRNAHPGDTFNYADGGKTYNSYPTY